MQKEKHRQEIPEKSKISDPAKKKKTKKRKKKKRISRIPVQSTQQNIPIRDLYNGIIITKDQRYIKVIEVKPITFLLLSPKEQGKVASAFEKVLKSSPVNMQLMCVTLPADLSIQLNKLDSDIPAKQMIPAARSIMNTARS